MGPGTVLVLLLVVLVVAFGRSVWRMSEEDYRRDRDRRGEDEDPDRYDDRGALRRHWGGWGRPGM